MRPSLDERALAPLAPVLEVHQGLVTVEEGIDPRELALVAIGGAGPTHGAEIASSLGIRRVIDHDTMKATDTATSSTPVATKMSKT